MDKKLGEGTTPGPWRVSQSGKYIQHCQPGTLLNICQMLCVDIDEDSANAHLISKAWLLPQVIEFLLSLQQIGSTKELPLTILNLIYDANTLLAKLESED